MVEQGGGVVSKVAIKEKVDFERIDISDEDIAQMVSVLSGSGNSVVGTDPRELERPLRDAFQSEFAFATSSGSSSLLAAAMLLRQRGAALGAEVIIPSFAFPTTAATFASVGFNIVFVDVEFPSLYLDPVAVAAAVTANTCAVVCLPYNGVVGDFEMLAHVASENDLFIVEDAAQAFGARWHGKGVGTLGDVGCVSFDRAKAIIGGQVGALLCGDAGIESQLREITEYGTNRTSFIRGEVDRYGWTSLGSNLVASGIDAALLSAQLKRSSRIVARRREIFSAYEERLESTACERGWTIHRAQPGDSGGVNMFPLLLSHVTEGRAFIAHMKAHGIGVRDHFQALHSSEAGRKYGSVVGELPMTEQAVKRLVRLPFHNNLSIDEIDRVVAAAQSFPSGR